MTEPCECGEPATEWIDVEARCSRCFVRVLARTLAQALEAEPALEAELLAVLCPKPDAAVAIEDLTPRIEACRRLVGPAARRAVDLLALDVLDAIASGHPTPSELAATIVASGLLGKADSPG